MHIYTESLRIFLLPNSQKNYTETITVYILFEWSLNLYKAKLILSKK